MKQGEKLKDEWKDEEYAMEAGGQLWLINGGSFQQVLDTPQKVEISVRHTFTLSKKCWTHSENWWTHPRVYWTHEADV